MLEEGPSLRQLKQDIIALGSLRRHSDAVLDQVDNVFMLDSLQCVDFRFDNFTNATAIVEYLQGVLRPRVVSRCLDYA